MTTCLCFLWAGAVHVIKMDSTNDTWSKWQNFSRQSESMTLWNLLCVSTLRLVWIHCMEALHPSFQSLVQLHSSSSPEGKNKKTKLQHCRAPNYQHLTTQNRSETMNNTILGVIGFTCPCIAMMFIIHSASRFTFQKEKKNQSLIYLILDLLFL